MMYKVVCVRDRAADAYGVPVFVASVGGAIRSFSDEVNRTDGQNNTMAKHPEDYDLFLLGTYDDSTGNFSCGIPKQIAVGKDMVIQK